MASGMIKGAFLQKLGELEKRGFSKGEYVIWGSGPLAIRGLKEARDIDLLVTQLCWKRLAKNHPIEGEKNNLIRLGEIEVWSDCMNLTPIIDQMIEHCDWIEGYPFMKLPYTVCWKEELAREKDLRDVALIEEFLKASSKGER